MQFVVILQIDDYRLQLEAIIVLGIDSETLQNAARQNSSALRDRERVIQRVGMLGSMHV